MSKDVYRPWWHADEPIEPFLRTIVGEGLTLVLSGAAITVAVLVLGAWAGLVR